MTIKAQTDSEHSYSEPVDLYLGIERVALDLSEALAEHEREPATDVWRSFWDRITDGGPVPPRFPKPEDLQPIADAWAEEQ